MKMQQQAKNMSTIDSSPGGACQNKFAVGEHSNGSGGSSGKAIKMNVNASFGSHIEYSIKSSGSVFVKENTGNIKDFYKISSCIGRGKYQILIHFSSRRLWRSEKMSPQRDQGSQSSQNN